MPALLTAVRRSILGYRRPLSGVRSEFTSIGRLPPGALTPAVAVLPVAERVVRTYTGGALLVERTLSAEFWLSAASESAAAAKAVEFGQRFREVVRNHERFPFEDPSARPQAFSYELGSVELTDPVFSAAGAVLVGAVVPLRVASKDFHTLPLPSERGSRRYSASADSGMVDLVWRRLKGHRRGRLSAVRGFERHLVRPPLLLGNTVNVAFDAEVSDRHAAGIDASTVMPVVTVWSAVRPGRNENLIEAARIVEEIKDILFEATTFEGAVEWSRWRGVEWGIDENNKGVEFYAARLVFEMARREAVHGGFPELR